ncbi:reverse transcriptase [Plakobranchus ocellatus]|uniref:Reverse transcriptase n=1 Tax=Plakobranchus ocellatus TaxID=259542 RepID=A0AAV3YAB0_9GAST|nr:reverse transcriptase [Plakobranchus ocellatus]
MVIKNRRQGKGDMIIDEIRNKEDSTRVQKAVQQPPQGHWTIWGTAIQRSLTWNDVWHMAPLRISFLIRSIYDLLSSNANLV